MRMHRYIVIMFILSLFVLGCGGNKPSKPHEVKNLTLNLQEGDPPSLNPYLGVDLRSRCLYLTLFEPLMRRHADGSLRPAAAESVEISDDQTIYSFHIRPHLWSNNEPVTSYHFEKAWKFAINPTSPCLRPDLFYVIKNAKKAKKGKLPLENVKIHCPDSNTLIVELEHPTPYFLELAATSFFLPLYSPSNEEPSYFNGPYLLAKHVPDESLTFHKNPHYWDSANVEIDTIHFLMIKDPMTAFALFEKNELDVIGDPFSSIPFDLIPQLQSSNQLESKIVSRIFYLLMNTETFPLNNPSLRKALSLSIDRDAFTEHVFFGQIPTLSLLPRPLSLIDSQGIEREDRNLLFEQALEELGLTRATFPTLTFSYAELTGQKQMAEFIREQWEQILGIKVKLKCSEWNVHSFDLRNKNYEMGTLHLTTIYQDQMFYFDLFRNKKNFSNYCKWESPIFKAYLEDSEKMTNSQERSDCLKKAEKYLMEQMPAIPIFTQNFQYLKRKELDLRITDLGIYDFKSAKIN